MEDIIPELNVLIGGENFAEIRRGKYCYIDKTGGMAAVIEVKRTKNADELPSLVEKGMKQITDNKYDALFRAIPFCPHHSPRKHCLLQKKLHGKGCGRRRTVQIVPKVIVCLAVRLAQDKKRGFAVHQEHQNPIAFICGGEEEI